MRHGVLLPAILSTSWSPIVVSAMKTSTWSSDRCSGIRSSIRSTTSIKHYSSPFKVPLSLHAAPTGYGDATEYTNNDGGSNSQTTFHNTSPIRCSSSHAASIIQNSSVGDGLLIITSDASGRGGGSKHDGMASILRIRHGASFLKQNNETTIQSTNENDGEKKEDLIDVISRRTVPSRTSSEVGAISLGIKRALGIIPPSWRKQILILSDSEYALDFFCGNEDRKLNDFNSVNNPIQKTGAVKNKLKRRKGTSASGKNRGKKRQTTQSIESREEAHRRALVALMKETPNGILFAKIRSSSRGVVRVNSSVIGGTIEDGTDDNVEEVDASWNGIGFIDHDAADHLSSIVRSIANSYDGSESEMGSSNLAYPLGKDDLAWLANSDADLTTATTTEEDENEENDSDVPRSSDFWRTIEVIGSDARQDRLERNQRRTAIIEGMIGSSLLDLTQGM